MINNYYQSWKRSKYGSKKAECAHGHVHDSQREACRCNELHILQYCGELTDLQIQRKYVLIPAQRDESGKLVEYEVSYIADFEYIENGEKVVEDNQSYARGASYQLFSIKRKLMLYKFGIKVKELR